ncbi:DUF2806 domain-containing protein [Brevundimonas sp.]|uniref:DUF2806 domain-containing protein n=1 Tax=Brevundimonas sp. TaxID=1871086 RepID=UPI003F71FB02
MGDDTDQKNPLAIIGQTIPAGWIKSAQDRAVGAIRHVVGAKLPGLLAESQAHRDERDARSAFKRGLVEAAVDKAKTNPELVDRMLDRLVDEEFGRQENREAVASLAIEHLSADPSNEEPAAAGEMDVDWLNIFTRHAEAATSERLRDMWGRVLAGEIRSPGAVSLRTMQFVSTLDRPVIEAAQEVLPWILGGQWLPHQVSKHVALEKLQLARDEGLIGSLDSDLKTTITFTAEPWAATFGDLGVILIADAGTTAVFPAISISRIARDLAAIIPLSPTEVPARAFGELMKGQSAVKRIRIGPIRTEGGVVRQRDATLIDDWTREQSSPLAPTG